jgi:FtsZ-interacting cell division protein ZipA
MMVVIVVVVVVVVIIAVIFDGLNDLMDNRSDVFVDDWNGDLFNERK